ncbi:hypothetical protein RYX56_10140, partial [Alkalihalophilus lindianensis]
HLVLKIDEISCISISLGFCSVFKELFRPSLVGDLTNIPSQQRSVNTFFSSCLFALLWCVSATSNNIPYTKYFMQHFFKEK